MKIQKMSYGGLEDGFWTKVNVTVEHKGKNYSGVFLMENDGRDIEFEGGLRDLSQELQMELNMLLQQALDPIWKQGYSEWENQ